MAKTATSRKRRGSKTRSLTPYAPFSSPQLKDPKLVSEALLECIKTGDLEAFREVLIAFVLSTNKSDLAQKAGIARRTLYDLLDTKKKFNPELSTVSAVIRALAG